jgi:organic radical activating enzyme
MDDMNEMSKSGTSGKIIVVNKIFQSIQGEGYWTGLPALFIRLHGCNLKCPWCDTKETWAGSAGEGHIHTTRQVADVINDTIVPTIIFTGGEPLIQVDAIKHIWELTADHSPAHYFHLETNGTLPVGPFIYNWVTVSPKPPEYLVPKTFSELKFVVTGEEVLEVALEFHAKHPFKPISLQPVSNRADMIRLCTEFLLSHRLIPAMRLSIQVHKLIGLP